MTRIPLILDCDPGVDDAVALLLAFASLDRLDLRGVTTVAGNVGLAQTARNARILRQLAGGTAERVPVFQGCARPMVREPIAADHFHGASGLGNLAIFEPALPVAPGHAVHFIVETLLREPAGTVSLAVTGPMTNVAMAMRLEPAIVPRIRQVVFMGGARSEAGNVTASAEYNIHADPHAAAVVCGAGVPLVAFGLDATHQVRSTPARIARLRALGSAAARAAADLLEFSAALEWNVATGRGAPLHDPCPIAWLLAPELFELVPCHLDVEIVSPLTLGHTSVEFRPQAGRAMHVRWATRADDAGVFELLAQRLARL
jgi:purine nucleosidase